MFCKECGTQLPDNVVNCPRCGTPVQESRNALIRPGAVPVQQAQPQVVYMQAPVQAPAQQAAQPAVQTKSAKRTNGFGIVGFVYAFFSLFLGGITFFPGFVMSCVGVAQRKECTNGNGVAVAGLIFAIINILEIVAIVYFILFADGLEWVENFLSRFL